MAIPLTLDGAFPSEEALRAMIQQRKVCFDHDPFYVRNADGQIVQIGFQLNLYAAFADPHHLPIGDDPEHRDILRDLSNLCRVFFQSLDVLKPCEHPEPPVPRVVYSPERRMRAEVCLQVPIFDREHFGAKPGRSLKELLETAECLLKFLGARPGRWDEAKNAGTESSEPCRAHAEAAMKAKDRDV
jgi:hypothetical protein